MALAHNARPHMSLLTELVWFRACWLHICRSWRSFAGLEQNGNRRNMLSAKATRSLGESQSHRALGIGHLALTK